MSDDVESKLNEIFSARAEKQAAALQAQREEKTVQDSALQEFLTLKDSLIRPTFEALAHKLSDRGHESRIFESHDGEGAQGRAQQYETIGLRFLTDSGTHFGRGSEYPHITLSFEKARRKVHFFRSTMTIGKGGMSGSDGSIDLDSVTEALINQKALKIIAEIYS